MTATPQGASIPRTEAFIVTNHSCNLHCSYCGTHDLPKGLLRAEAIGGLFQALAGAGIHTIRFIGGEPTLRKDIWELVARARALGLRTILHSNGAFLRPLPENPADFPDVLHTCLNGLPDVHDAIRGAGTYAKAVSAIQLFRGHGREVEVDMIIGAGNATWENAAHVLGLAAEHGFRVLFQKVFDHGLVLPTEGALAASKASSEAASKVFAALAHAHDPATMACGPEILAALAAGDGVPLDRCRNAILVAGYDGRLAHCFDMLPQAKDDWRETGWEAALAALHDVRVSCADCPYAIHARSSLEAGARCRGESS